MKTNLKTLLVVGATLLGLACHAQNNAVLLTTVTNEEVAEVMEFQDTSIDVVLNNLATQAGLNIHIDSKITETLYGADGKSTRKVTIKWRNLSARQALVAVLDNYNYVAIPDPKTKVVKITVKDPAAQEPLVLKLVDVKHANVTNMLALIKSSISARSIVQADSRGSRLILSVTETEFANISNILGRVDSEIPQILVEAKFIETSKNPKSAKGVDWTQTLASQNIKFGNPGGINYNTDTGFTPDAFWLNASGVEVVLSFLNTENEAEFIAQPRAVVMDGQSVDLSSVRNIPVFEEEQGSVSSGVQQASTVKPNYNLTVTDSTTGRETVLNEVGIKMRVTPHKVGEKDVFMDLLPEVSVVEVVPAKATLGGKESESPIFRRQKLSTTATVPSGNTLVLGGLLTDELSTGYTKVPLLGDVPYLGYLFRRDTKSREKKNMLIFVTPTLVERPDFQPTPSDFLKTKPVVRPDLDEPAWDTGAPASKYRPLF